MNGHVKLIGDVYRPLSMIPETDPPPAPPQISESRL
jgi:hypothetical protein